MKPKFKFILFLVTIFSFATNLGAQDATLSGKITESGDPEGLIGVAIQVGETGTTTELDGTYSIQLAPGTYDVEFSYLGLETIKESITLGMAENKVFDLVMGESVNLMDVVTVTSSKHEQKQSEVIATVAIIQPELLESNNNTAVDQVVKKVPGVEIVDGQPSIRGGAGYSYGAGSRVLLLLDDIPALQADAGFPQWNDIPVENIAQIEIVKGAASALYGSSAMNGIINIRTAYAKSDPETSFSTFYTHFDKFSGDVDRTWWDGAIDITKTNDDGTEEIIEGHQPKLFGDQKGYNTPMQLGVSASHRRKIGKFDLVLGGYALRNDGHNLESYNRYGRFNVGTRYRITDNLSVGFNSNFNKGNSGSFFYWLDGEEGATAPSGPDVINKSKVNRYTIDPFVTYFDKSGNKHKLMGRYYSVVNDNVSNRSNFSNLSYGEYQFQRNLEDINLIATAGIVGMHTNVEAELYSDTTFKADNLAGYLQLDKKIGDRLNLSLGARYEWNQLKSPEEIVINASNTEFIKDGKETDSRAVFRAGFNYAFGEYTHLRGSWGQGYRYPTIAEKFINTSLGVVGIVPNPSLQPETGWSAELGLQQGWKIPGTKLQGFADLSFFYSEYQDMMEFGFNSEPTVLAFTSENVGDTRIYGSEINIAGQGKFNDDFGVTFLIGYTYIVPKFQEFDTTPIAAGETRTQGQLNAFRSSIDENVLKYRFENTFKGDVEFNYKKFKLGFAAAINSEMRAVDEIFLGIIPGVREFREENKGFAAFDARFSYQLTENFKLSLVGKNVTNQLYSVRPGLLEAPRNVALRFDAKF